MSGFGGRLGCVGKTRAALASADSVGAGTGGGGMANESRRADNCVTVVGV